MPRFGTMNVKPWAEGIVSDIRDYKTESVALPKAQILNLTLEIDDNKSDNLLPPAMHPSIPSYTIINVMHCPESPWGKFSIAEVRIAGRTVVRPRGFVLRSFVDTPDARRELSNRWGFPVAEGEIDLETRHDRIQARVRAGAKTILDCELIDRDFISGADIQYLANMQLARSKIDGKLILVQVDPEFTFSKAERGKPKVNILDAGAWKTGGNLEIHNPISSSYAIADVKMPVVRYIVDPERPAFQGTTKVAA
ncbi:MAG TPA: hypothetical protein VGI47_12005 [Candidatus Binataceae bacterium]